MTTANLLNVSPVKGVQVDVSKKLQEEAIEVTEIFASMMEQTVNSGSQMVDDDTSSEIGISKTEGTRAITDSYERYSYKDNQIEPAEKHEVSAEELDAVEETLEQVEEEILNAISEEYGVDEENIRDLLENLGLTVFDLLDPKNLVSFVTALTGVASGEELLLDESFLKIMETMDTLSNDLMKEWSVDANGLQDIISQMETVNLENEEVTFESKVDAQAEGLSTENEVSMTVQQDSEAIQNVQNTENAQNSVEVSEETEDGMKILAEEQEEPLEKTVVKTESEEVKASPDIDEKTSLSSNKNSEKDSFMNQDTSSEQVFVTGQSSQNAGQVSEMPQTQFSSYFSVDTAQIMEQIAEQIKVVVTPDTTSMEMQLNPENLGKIYLHVSTEEGIVNAHFTATTEVVKEALETQIATLRENLVQAGVKVDAIEVTIASHEFERNLEQNQNAPKEEQMVEEQPQKRRNITVDALDELAGVMTEEETLVAQIMRDNGNSVDYTV